jgi:membrane protein required for colicin V production
MPITLLDFIVLGVVFVSAFLAMVRGFTREVLSVVAWGGAAAATVFFFPQVHAWVAQDLKIEPAIVAQVVSGAGIFLTTLILVSLVTMRISDMILDSRIGPIDRTLGFVYGAARGFLLVVIAFVFFIWLVPAEGQPEWVRNAQTRELLETAGQTLQSFLPDDPEATIFKQFKGVPNRSGDGVEPPDAEPVRPNAPSSTPAPSDNKANEPQTMQQLLDSRKTGN